MTKGLALAAVLVASLASGCGYMGSARTLDPAQFDNEPGWIAVRSVQLQRQKTDNDCGAASVAMLLTHWGQPATPEDIVAAVPATKDGMRAGQLRDLIKERGLKGFLIHGNLDDLKTELSNRRPVIVGLIKPYSNGGYSHYEVVVGINEEERRIATLDPARGPRQNTYEGFLQEWEPAGTLTIVVIGADRPARTATAAFGPPTALSPLMAAPEPDGQPSGSRRPPN